MPSRQGLTSEPRTGLGPCLLSLGELHPDVGVLLLLGEESPRVSAGRRRRWRLDGALPFLRSGFFLPSSSFLGLQRSFTLGSEIVFRRGKCSGGSLDRLGTGGRKLLSMEQVGLSVSKGLEVL